MVLSPPVLQIVNTPGMWWVKTNASGPNAGNYDTTNSAGTGIGGFNDWYVPAANEMQIAYFFLKPDTTANTTTQGNIPTSVAPYQPNTRYGPGYPNQTTNPLFQTGGSEAFETGNYYWASSQYGASSNNAYIHRFAEGYYAAQGKTSSII